MAYFKSLTTPDGETVIVNIDAIATLKRTAATTTIEFCPGAVIVRETPDEIVAKSEFRGTIEPAKGDELRA